MNPVRDKTSEISADSQASRISNGMKVLMLSGDANLLVPGSEPATRLALQRSAVDRLDVFVWPQAHSLQNILKSARITTYDVVTAQDPFWRGLLALYVAKRFGAKLNVQVHADLSEVSFFRRLLAQFVLRHADSIRVVSSSLKAQVEAVRVWAPVRVLPVFVDMEPFRGVERIPHTHPTVLWIGRFEAEKDPLAALSVYTEIRERIPEARMVMLGTGTLAARLKQAAAGLPVEFPGWKDPKPYLASADVVLSTSRSESFGVSIVEALAAGVPVVAPDVGIAREAGAVVAPRNQLAAAVVSLLMSRERGFLHITLPGGDAWAQAWKDTL